MNVQRREQWGIIRTIFIAWNEGHESFLFYYTTNDYFRFLYAIMSMNAKEWERNERQWRRKISSNNNYLWAFCLLLTFSCGSARLFVGAVHAYFFKYLHSTMNSWHKILSFAVKHDVLWQQKRRKIKIKQGMILCCWVSDEDNSQKLCKLFQNKPHVCIKFRALIRSTAAC